MANTKIRQDQIDGYMHTQDADLLLGVNDGGTERTAIQVHGDEGSVSFPRQSYVKASSAGTLTVAANNTVTTVTWTESEDTLSEFTSNAFTCLDDGVYMVSAFVQWRTTVTAKAYWIAIYVGDSAWGAVEDTLNSAPSRFVQTISVPVKLTAGQVVTVRIRQSNTSSITVEDRALGITKIS
jgi:flagellar basal body rod protein FlgF